MNSRLSTYQSWGRYPKALPSAAHSVFWSHKPIDFQVQDKTFLPYANGRSYGDVCLNENGILLDMRPLNRFIAFDSTLGILRCEAGVTLADIANLAMPKGWFLPVTPGTQFVSIGGAIANDVHGKNHHKAGTFGLHVCCFELLRSDGQRLLCSPDSNSDFFRATIGGLGLTGVILWAEIQLRPIPGPWIAAQRLRCRGIEEFFDLSEASDKKYEYTVAWIDCFASSRDIGRGIFIRGNHAEHSSPAEIPCSKRKFTRVPFDFPRFVLNNFIMKLLNSMYYRSSRKNGKPGFESYQDFFYPLDGIHEWNRLYGQCGFLQYQCLIPPEHQREGIRMILNRIKQSNAGSFLAVLKQFGNIRSPGLMSFPRPGLTLALDFPFRGERTLKLLSTLDEIVLSLGGSVYPAKDARMSEQSFKSFYPHWSSLSDFIDPKFSSSFWRRVTVKETHM